MEERVECAAKGCLKPPAAIFGGQFYCRGHFVATCYARLDFCADLLNTRVFTDRMSQEMSNFITECTQQASKLSETAKDLNHMERAWLLDILFYAADLGSHMRRSPRKALAIPVRVHCETPGRPWQEEMQTLSVSRFGAMVECRQTIRPGDVLLVEHLESGRSAQARVVWSWKSRSGSFVAGFEFTRCDNFWDLDWADSPAISVDSQSSVPL